MDFIKFFSEILESIKSEKPVIHHITNYVTVNDCANIVLALGGSPVMADDPNEVEEMVSLASSLVLNVGTLNQRTAESFILAGKKANSLGIPVILDPVGVGATKLRNETVKNIIKDIDVSVLKGNMSEIKYIYDNTGMTRGVDSVDDSMDGGKEIALNLAKRLNCIVVITGKIDIVSDGEKTFYIDNGHKILSKVTGTGCMITSLIALCCGTKYNSLISTMMGVMIMGIAGEKAYEVLDNEENYGSFRVKLIDAIGNFKLEDIKKRGKVYEG